MEGKSTIRWVIGVAIAILAAGGGAVAWIELFTSDPEQVPTATWRSLQSNYLESFEVEYIDPAMAAVWSDFNDGVWAGENRDGTYCLNNTTDESGAQYLFVGLDTDSSNTPASVEVRSGSHPGSTSISAAGLLYRFDETNTYYYAFTISNTGVVYVYKKNEIGYNVLYTGKSQNFEPGQFNRIGVIGRGNSLHFYINDTLEKVIVDDQIKSGEPGIIGIGIGRHCFDNYTIYRNVEMLPG